MRSMRSSTSSGVFVGHDGESLKPEKHPGRHEDLSADPDHLHAFREKPLCLGKIREIHGLRVRPGIRFAVRAASQQALVLLGPDPRVLSRKVTVRIIRNELPVDRPGRVNHAFADPDVVVPGPATELDVVLQGPDRFAEVCLLHLPVNHQFHVRNPAVLLPEQGVPQVLEIRFPVRIPSRSWHLLQ